jgi:hypothetical protein
VLSCADGSKYTLGFSNTRGVDVVEIAPSRCTFVEVVFTEADGTIRRRGELSPREGGTQDFAPGQAYYLGDFFAERLRLRHRPEAPRRMAACPRSAQRSRHLALRRL